MNLSQNSKESLQKYCANVLKWNKAYNLISSSQQSEKDVWERHIEDSVQLYDIIGKHDDCTIVDYGSGAGFPAIPCAILAAEQNKNINFVMIESVNKKALFLQDTIRLLGLKNISARCERIENVKDIKADIITARAFSKIDEIFDISKDIAKPYTKYILLKGKNVNDEIAISQKKYSFNFQLVNSVTGDGAIFIGSDIKSL